MDINYERLNNGFSFQSLDRRLTQNSNETNNHINESWNKINSGLSGTLNEISKALPAENCPNLGKEESKISSYAEICLNLAGGHQLLRIDSFSPKPFFVWCDNVTHGGGWTVIQRRIDGSVNFYRNWTDYKSGFGNLAHEFFIGIDRLHALTTTSVNELLIVMKDKANEERFAKYDAFAIGDENQYYAINILGEYSGDAGNNLLNHHLTRFYTEDNDSPKKCAKTYTRAWWEKEDYCQASLNGKYGDDTHGKGINWFTFHGYRYSLPYVQMMVRPRSQ